ncbi:MAG TPA: TlpA disulfide reductase family protein [Candidatus Polarisedimenticolia bacterium]|nr:TlpA disulfide reductase family protein [Candidatus Polarisedimenticolia bacterium]
MKWIDAWAGAGIFLVVLTANADEQFAELKCGDNLYKNVTITTVTATDIYFTYSGGIGNAKLKNLSPELQKHFHFDALKAGTEEKAQAEATAQYRQNAIAEAANRDEKLPPPYYDSGDLVVPKIFARSFRGEKPPPIVIDRWVTLPPQKPEGKFLMLLFWATTGVQNRRVVPLINDFAAKFKDRMMVIGLSNEPDDVMRTNMPPVNFSVGTDMQGRSLQAFEVTGIPHVVLIDPTGIVRFEGPPIYLTEKDLKHFLDTYGP